MIKRAIALLLAFLFCLGLVACAGNGGKDTEAVSGDGTTDTEGNIPDTSEEELAYLKKYGDMASAEEWIKTNITESDCPPINFAVGKTNSTSLTWTKEISEITTVIDYPDSDPAERSFYTVTFKNEDNNLAVEVLVTSYPNYPVVEYEATIKNLSDKPSDVIKNVYSIYGDIYGACDEMTVYYSKGSTNDGVEDYKELVKKLVAEKSSLKVESTSGKPTNDFLPDFNIEKKGGDGVIALLSWQGTWKAELELKNSGLHFEGGQYKTEFNLLGSETHRCPGVVLIFYKDSNVYGQNIYRRWIYKHNFMRENGTKTGVNVLFSTGPVDDGIIDVQSTAECDLLALKAVKAYQFERQVDLFAQDAGWTDYGTQTSWATCVGTWRVDSKRYPNGLKEISDAAKALGLGYMLWVEPERVAKGQDISNEHPEYLIYYREVAGKNKYFANDNVGLGSWGLVNLGNDEALEYICDMLNNIIKEQGVTVYRQDFNFFPAPYWEAYDGKEEKDLGLKRTGRTEEQYCNGYLKLFDSIIENNPGIAIDACASGGMRYDLETMRRAYCHTRTDWFGTTEKAQSDTYTSSKWMPYWGTAFAEYKTQYGVRSRIAFDIGIGVIAMSNYDFKTYFKEMGAAIRDWRFLGQHIAEDYYPLTSYLDSKSEGVMALQYDCPSNGTGIVVAYVRGLGHNETLYPYALDENATYEWYDLDDEKNVQTATGKELMEKGFTVTSAENTGENIVNADTGLIACAKVFVYSKVQ